MVSAGPTAVARVARQPPRQPSHGARPRGAKASFKPPSRTSAARTAGMNPECLDDKADPAGQALCDNMRELTAHLRGIYHSISREDPDPEGFANVEGHPVVALCDSMRELTAQLRGIFHNLKHEDAEGHEFGAMKQRHPLVASLAESLHREALRMLEDGPGKAPGKAREVHSTAPAPNGPAAVPGNPKAGLPVSTRPLEQGQGCPSPNSRQPSRSFGGRRTRPRPRPASPRDNLARKRLASRESGPERLKRLGLVGIPTEEVDPQATRRPRPRHVGHVAQEADRPPSPCQRSREANASLRARSKASDAGEKKGNKAKKDSETRRPVSPSEAKTTRLKPSVLKENKATEEELRKPQAPRTSGAGAARPRATAGAGATEKSKRRIDEKKRRDASRESGTERLQRLGLVGLPGARKDEAASRRLTRKAPAQEAEDPSGKRAAGAAAGAAAAARTVRAVSAAPVSEAIAPESAETERGFPRESRPLGMQESDMAAMDGDVRRMLEWAAAEAAHTRRVAARVANFPTEGVAHYSVARIRETNQGRLANRLRAATLNRARQARQAMQDLFFDGLGQDGLPFRTPGMVPRGEVFPWGQQMHPDHLEESMDEELSQPDEEESREASYLTEADRQRIGEVLAEQERRRSGLRGSAFAEPAGDASAARPRTLGTMWPTFSPGRRPPPEVPWPSEPGSQPDGHRPPSRGGESWQPLGQTTPPAYEQVTPELLQLWQIQEMQQQPSEPVEPAAQEEETGEELPSAPIATDSGVDGSPEVHGSPDDHPGPGGHEIPDAIDALELPDRRTDRLQEDEVEQHLGETEDAESEVYSEGMESEVPDDDENSEGGLESEVPDDDEISEEDLDLEDQLDRPEEPAQEAPLREEPPQFKVASVSSESVEEEIASIHSSLDQLSFQEAEVASVHSSEEELSHFEEVEVTETTGFQADEWILEVSPSQAAATSPPSSFPEPESKPTKPAKPSPALRSDAKGDATVQDITEEVVAVIMEELINDTVQSSATASTAPEPALWHPTPVAPPFIDIFNEDSAPDGSSAESEPVVQPSPRRPLPAASSTSSSPSSGKGAAGSAEPVGDRAAVPPRGAVAVAGEELEGRQSKDGPPRPPSPPPDARSLAVTTAPSFQASPPSASPPRPKGKQEQADLISQELLETLLGEALQEYEGAAFHSASPVEEARVSIGSSGPSPLVAGAKPIDTSEAVVGPFVDAAFQYFGVVDETQPVASPVPPVEEWFPSVLEIMRSKATSNEETEESEAPEETERMARERHAAIEGFTRLLADALLEIASEEVKEQGPRVMGWRRPCFGEAPLSRFREKQAKENQTSSQKQTWEKVRSKLMELVRFGWRAEATEETTAQSGPPGRMTIDLEAGAAGALALANLDEGIDALLEEEICSDEASWLDIKADVQKVKNEVARMIFADLVDELANEIARLWAPTSS